MRYVFDVLTEYDAIDGEVYRDMVHVSQETRQAMALRIAQIVAGEVRSGQQASR